MSQPADPHHTFNSFTAAAKRALADAQLEAEALGHAYIGTEHLLLGLLRSRGGAARALEACGVSLEKVRAAVLFIVSGGKPSTNLPEGLTERAKKVIELAVDEARANGDARIRTTHLAIAIVREGAGIGAGVLESLGVNLERVRAATRLVGADEQ